MEVSVDRKVDVAILGAGTAGLSAFKEAEKVTKNLVVVNDGPYGTTCARVGCMPSKSLIQIANDYFRRTVFEKEGILGSGALNLDGRKAMTHVRELRDGFVRGVNRDVEAIGERNIKGKAVFIDPTTIKVGSEIIQAKSVIIATGSRPFVPESWAEFGSRIITSDSIFELEDLPKSVAVIGLGVIGLELGQALSRLGVEVTGINKSMSIGGITDPVVNSAAVKSLQQEFPLWLGSEASLKWEGEKIRVSAGERSVVVDYVLSSMGRRPNLESLELENLGVSLDRKGIPRFDPTTLRVGHLPIYIAGDVNSERAILHEAADEGRIAGYNSVRSAIHSFCRRTPMAITFTEPNIASVGKRFSELSETDVAIGEIDFSRQGRASIMSKNKGMLRIYADRKSGILLGSEMIAPGGEYLAHYLSVLIETEMSVFEALRLPVYHPVLHEGLRTAIRDASRKVDVSEKGFELALCDASAAQGLM